MVSAVPLVATVVVDAGSEAALIRWPFPVVVERSLVEIRRPALLAS
jgi:hypothetical protein